MVLIRVKCVINWSRIERVCSLCIKLDFEEGKSPQDELRTNSSSFCVRRRNDDGGDFFRELLFINRLFFDGDDKRWCAACVGDEECATCLRDLFGLKRFFDNNVSYINRVIYIC